MSGLIPRDFINDIINRTDIVALIESRFQLKKAGRNYQACCPFHTENSPSFTVSPAKQFYYCFGCGASGNAIGFLMAYDRLEFVEAVETLAKLAGVDVPHTGNTAPQKSAPDLYAPLQQTCERYQRQLRNSPQAIQYLKSRGVSGEIAKSFALGFSPDDNYDAFRGRIIFPIRDRRGRVIGFGGRVLDNQKQPKYLNSPDSPIFHKSTVLYGLYEARQTNRSLKQILVVEGYMDVISLAVAGITHAVATLGTATTTQHVQQLLQQAPSIVFCFDGDNAGRKAAWRALESALPALQDEAEARFLFLPDGEDPDSLVKKEGKTDFLARVAQSQPLADFFFAHLKTQANIHTVEGRAQYAKLALPYIETVAAPIFREMLLTQLSALVRLEKAQLAQFAHLTVSPAKTASKIQRTPMRLAIALLLQYPVLVKHMAVDIAQLTGAGSELLRQIAGLLKQHTQLTTGQLIEYFRDKKESTLVHRLSMWNHGVPEKGAAAEFQDILNYLYKQQREKNIEKLLQKSAQNSLSELERTQLQILLVEK